MMMRNLLYTQMINAMKIYNKKNIVVLLLLCSTTTIRAQSDTSFSTTRISLTEYLSLVAKQNLEYAAQKYNVSMVEANIEIAKIFPDPQLVLGTFDNQNASKHLGHGLNGELSTTIELGGKRKARINLAQSQLAFNKAQLEDYFRNLRADAAQGFCTAILNNGLLKVQQNSYSQMKQLADGDSIRFKLGDITEVDAHQSKVEAGNLLNSLYQNEADWKTALVQLGLNTGHIQNDTLLEPSNEFVHLEREFSLKDLIVNAQNNRADLVAALGSKDVANKNLQLVKANRKIDLGVNFGMQYNGVATNETAPTPAYHSLSAGISIPLKLSNRYKGDLKVAQFAITQTEVQYQQVLLTIQSEVTQAFMNYKAAQKQVYQFKSGLLFDAQKVLDGKVYSYKRGASSLLEVLNAQRTYNDMQQNYNQSLFNYATSLIVLEKAAGIWDITF